MTVGRCIHLAIDASVDGRCCGCCSALLAHSMCSLDRNLFAIIDLRRVSDKDNQLNFTGNGLPS